MDPKLEVGLFIGGGVLVVGALLYAASQGSTTTPVQGVFSSQPSDAAVQAITQASAQDDAASQQAAATRSTNATNALLGLAGLAEQQSVAGTNAAAATQQLQISTGATTAQDQITTAATTAQAQLNDNATVNADSILASANEIIANYTNQTSQFVAQQQEKAAEAADQANESVAQISTAANSTNILNTLDAQQNEVSLTKNAATSASNNGLLESILGGVASAFGGFFSSPTPVTGTVPTSTITLGQALGNVGSTASGIAGEIESAGQNAAGAFNPSSIGSIGSASQSPSGSFNPDASLGTSIFPTIAGII